ADIFGMDIATGCSGYAAWPLWMLGYPDQALERIRRTLSFGQERRHLSSTVMALSHAAAGHLFRREAQTAKNLAEEAIALATEHGFDLWKALTTIHLGTALVQGGQEALGIVNIEEGIKSSKALGMLTGGWGVGELADAYGKTGQPLRGLKVIAEALTVAHEKR